MLQRLLRTHAAAMVLVVSVVSGTVIVIHHHEEDHSGDCQQREKRTTTILSDRSRFSFFIFAILDVRQLDILHGNGDIGRV
jgi:hypothetical protein